MKRRILRPWELGRLVRVNPPAWGSAHRLQDALTIADLKRIAQRRVPRAVFDYAEGGADAEITLRRARQAFEDIEFSPRVLRDVTTVDTSREVLGRTSQLPFGIAPTGLTRLMHAAGETAGAAAAATAGIPFALSTLGTTSPEDVAKANPGGRNWLQLYVRRDRDLTIALMDRASRSGFETLLVTVDVPVSGLRLRDKRNGLSIPAQVTPRTILETIPHVRWWFDFITTDPFDFAVLDDPTASRADGRALSTLFGEVFDPSITIQDLDWIRQAWPGSIVVKGVQSKHDAALLATSGVDGILLSNHGGRQLDRAPVPLRLLPSIVKEMPSSVEVIIDSGITSGADIVAAIALGAKFTLIGRAYLYGLMAGGRAGVDRAIAILTEEITRTMQLLGVTTLDELTPDHVTQLR
ncbi:MAG: alpha-hydroxy acid oxidase [Pseudolysinimonas sp.]